MKLKLYFSTQHITMTEFCQKHGFNYAYIKHIRAGRARPSPELAEKIEKATHGKVDRLDLLYP
jgi:hypothetical protein